jgi:hypothetical protein
MDPGGSRVNDFDRSVADSGRPIFASKLVSSKYSPESAERPDFPVQDCRIVT